MEVEWKAFELRPEGLNVPPPPEEYLERAWRSVSALAARYNLKMRRHSHYGPSRLALEGARFAEDHGMIEAYNDAMFKALWVENRDISDLEVLVQVAEAIGLDNQAFRECLVKRTNMQRVLDDTAEAERLGITGIPCFIAGNRGAMGVQSFEQLKQLVEGAS